MAHGFNEDKSKFDLSELQSMVEEAVNDAWKKIYPVGSIYTSVNSTSPATLFGGTWTAINGRFLVAQGSNGQSGNNALNLSAGSTGGETNHTLTVSEMPSHSHTISNEYGYQQSFLTATRMPVVRTITIPNNSGADFFIPSTEVSQGGGYGNYDGTDTTGNDTAHNNLPPYLAVYMWKRTA